MRPHRALTHLASALALFGVSFGASPARAQVAAGDDRPVVERAAAERFAGLYQGHVTYKPGSAELEMLVELAPGTDGRLVGTITHPGFDLQYQPLEGFRVDGRKVYFHYRHFSEVRGPDALFEFEAELAADGASLSGVFIESRGRIPFALQRIGDAGTPFPERERRPLVDLAAAGDELRQAFNEARDQVRLILLLSPT